MSTESSHIASCTMSLTVLSGPDEGKSESFTKSRVTVGRDPRNDFVLSDGFVSGRHAEVVVRQGEIYFRDLKSRHGSTVVVGDFSKKLHDDQSLTSIEIEDGAEVQVGSSLVRLKVSSPARAKATADTPGSPRGTGGRGGSSHGTKQVEADGERVITTSREPKQAISQRLESADTRLAALFEVAGELNGLTGLDEILNLIVETAFEAFPATNFFAVTMGSTPEEVSEQPPLLTRTRGELPGDADAPILSRSILRRVAESGESVLYTKDSLGTDVSQSIIDAQITACMCAPLVGQKSLLGIMQVDTRGRGSMFTRQDLEMFNVLASNAAFAIERARLTEDIMEMFEGFVAASVNAIEARDPVTAGHSERVADYTLELARVVNDVERDELRDIHLDAEQLRELRYAALLHDFGKIAVGEDVIQKEARLPSRRMRQIRQRFDTICELKYRRWLQKRVRQLEPVDAEDYQRQLSEIDRRYQTLRDELNELYDWLEQIATKGRLTDEDIKGVKAVGERTFTDANGEIRPFLTPSEVENLCIRKGTLNQEEWAEMKSHAALSESYLDQIPWSDELEQVPCIAGAHHEKLDGSGYPRGISEEELMPQVRMLTIADIFDALTASDRPYRKAASIERAVEILQLEADDDKLDARLVDVFKSLVVPRIEDRVPNPQR